MSRKVAFVTGAGKVTGKQIALKFGEAGYNLGISYVNSEEGARDAVSQIEQMGGRAKAYCADTRDIARMGEVFDDLINCFGRFDVLVNNVGVTRFKPFLEINEDNYDEVIDINLKGTYFTSQSAARRMKTLGNGGVIVSLSSVHARGAWPGDTMYATSKAALNRLTETMALDLAEYGIRAVNVAPGYISMGAARSDAHKDRINKIKGRIPAGRFVEAGEIGDICVFLASDKASYITGVTLYADGGLLLPVVPENTYV
jgi:NAD(P)-dependent dehydrogenase (short-subunit alcohol dehydrogenase family)